MNSTNQLPYEDRVKYFYDDNPYSATPDVFELFRFYNQFFFEERLTASYVRWSNKMTLCAGTCAYQGQKSCIITLSEPLLKYRTNNELKETLIHEMIHAYFFVTDPESCKIDEGHGPKFLDMMYKINRNTQLNVSVYHKFHDEVDRCRQHIWKCDGPCQSKPPFYGIVKRSMNRPPQKADNWFERHQRDCGGNFIKIQSPEKLNKQKQQQSKSTKEQKQKQQSMQQQKQSQLNHQSYQQSNLDKYFLKKNKDEHTQSQILNMKMQTDKFKLWLTFELNQKTSIKEFYCYYSKIQEVFLLQHPDLELFHINEGAVENKENITDIKQLENLFQDKSLQLQMKISQSDNKSQSLQIKKLILQSEIKLQLDKPLLIQIQQIL